MINSVKQALSGPGIGPVAAAIALLLAVALIVSLGGWQVERTTLRRKISALIEESERSQSLWRAQLTACRAAADSARRQVQAAAGPDGEGRLLTEAPAGDDVCARMESADRAVLKTLRK